MGFDKAQTSLSLKVELIHLDMQKLNHQYGKKVNILTTAITLLHN